MLKQVRWGSVASLCLLLVVTEASADRRASLGAARSNLGGASRGNIGGGNLGAARGNVGAGNLGTSRGNIGAGNLGASRGSVGAGNLGNISGNRPNINASRPNVNTPNINLPNTSLPSLGGGSQINRPAINRPGNIGANRPNPGANRPGVIENLPSRPDLGNIGNRPGGGTGVPDFGSRPITRPDLGGVTRPNLGNVNRPNIGGNQRPDRPGGGISRPDFDNLPGDRPSRDRLDDFLGIQRPNSDRPSLGDRPNIDRPSIDRPNWNERPERPIIGGGDRNISIHNRPSWVNIERDRLLNVSNRWNTAITNRPDDLHRWVQHRPDRVARWRTWGNGVRFRWHVSGNGVFGPVWWTSHRPIFCQWHYWHHWNRHPWNHWWGRPAFPALTGWFVWRAPIVVWSQPIFYDFGPGGNVNFIDNRVFISGADVGSTEEFAQSAAELATVSPPEDDEEIEEMDWMALGTFAVSTSEKEGEPSRFVQLAVSQTGLISGTLFNQQTDVSQTVLGQVDQQTQRVAMRLGEDDNVVIETGLYNLTLEEAPVLVHFGPDKYEFFLLVRMDAPEEFDE